MKGLERTKNRDIGGIQVSGRKTGMSDNGVKKMRMIKEKLSHEQIDKLLKKLHIGTDSKPTHEKPEVQNN